MKGIKSHGMYILVVVIYFHILWVSKENPPSD